jgi:mannose-6-phosphate isomerase-like protein (cupin superfamily)
VGATSQEIAGKLLGAQSCTIAFARIEPGGGSEIDAHPKSEQVFFVLRGVFTLRDDKNNNHTAEAGQALYVAPGEPHAAMNLGKEETVCIVVTAPPL